MVFYSDKNMPLKVELKDESGMLLVQSPGEDELLFPYVWLRDNCQCSKCFHPVSLARLLLLADLKLDDKPQNVELENNDEIVYLTWSDGHRSPYPVTWLKDRAFTESVRQKRSKIYRRTQKLWGTEFKDILPKFDFEKVQKDDKELYEWMRNLETYGFVLLKNAPREPGQVKKMGERVAYLKITHYGETFTVQSKRDPNNLAYTGLKLGLHTDLPYYHYGPGIQMLHCIEQYEGEGGENDFSDGFYVAQLTKERNPEEYKILNTTPIDFWDVGEDVIKFDKVIPIYMFGTDQDGEMQRVTLNQQSRDSHMRVPLEQVKPFYTAMKNYNDALYNNSIRIKMEPGDIVCFDNMRVLHGRTGFQMSQTGSRHLEGGYIEWDELRSMQNVMKKELNMND